MKIVAISDLHFGHPRIDPSTMYLRLRKFFYPELMEADVVFVAGDLYDQLLTVNSKSHRYATMFINDMYRLSEANGLKVRLLHGTHSHDRDQLSIFDTNNTKINTKIINRVECEEITIGENIIRVAYIPDNISHKKSEEILMILDSVLTLKGWSTVDIVVGHGTFEHVIPPGSGHRPTCTFTQEQFLKLVDNGLIIMGHIHKPGRRDNVYYCGSFERFSHGEEENKGYWVFKKDHLWKSKFVVNDLATKFVSIQPQGDDTPATVKDFLNQVNDKFPCSAGNVRVLHDNPEIRSILHKVNNQHFPDILYSSKSITVKEVSDVLEIEEVTLGVFDDIKPSKENLGDLIYKFLDDNKQLVNIDKDNLMLKVQQLMM